MWVNVPKKKSKGRLDKAHWPESKKMEVLQAYLVMGILSLAARTCNVPEITVRVWKASKWWKDTEEELRRGSKLQLGAKLQSLVQKSLDVLDDRVSNGDYVMQQSPNFKDAEGNWQKGEITWVRKPISAEHANKITASLIDRQIAIEKSATAEPITDEGLEARMKKIKEDLMAFANKRYVPPSFSREPIDVTPLPVAVLEAPKPKEVVEVRTKISPGAKRMGLDPIREDGERVTLGRPSND